MINIVLYDSESVLRAAKKAIQYFGENRDLRTSKDTIWLHGVYLKFHPNLITVNPYGTSPFPNQYILDGLNHMLKGEEAYLTGDRQGGIYFDSFDSLTESDIILFH